MKTTLTTVLSASLLCFATGVASANITFDSTTYNFASTTKGIIWFDTVGTMNYDGNGNPVNVSGLLGTSAVKVDFLFSFGGNTALSQIYSLDANGTGGYTGPFGSVSGRSAESISSTSLFGGQAGTYQVRAWTGGASFSDLANTKVGVSAATAMTFGGLDGLGQNNIAPSAANNFNSFAIAAVPEPATLALGLFGAAGLLFRRRK